MLRQFTSIRRQLLSIHGCIWCWCHTTFRHRQINVQTTAAQISIRGPRKFIIFGESGGSGRLTTTCRWSVRLAYRTRGGSCFIHFSCSHPSSESCTKYYYYVLRTIHRIYLPSVELMLFSELTIGFDPRYFVPLLHLPLASASKHCQKAGKWGDMAKGERLEAGTLALLV